jgi:DNA polymerase-3 subunit epsilon
MTLQLTRPLVVIDTETTGTDPQTDRIVQIGLVRIEPAAPENLGEWSYLVDPGEPIPPEAIHVHGISDDDVYGQRRFRDVWSLVDGVLYGADLCAYNARFDLAMIDAEVRRAGLPAWDRSTTLVLDPMVIFHRRHPRDLAGALKHYCGRSHTHAHDALADCRATLDVLRAQMTAEDLPTMQHLYAVSLPEADDRYCDSGRKFAWRFHRPVHAQGKHRGKPIDCDLGYLNWMIGPRGIADLPPDTRALIERALAGHVPTREPEEQEA